MFDNNVYKQANLNIAIRSLENYTSFQYFCIGTYMFTGLEIEITFICKHIMLFQLEANLCSFRQLLV